jgi:antitoxin YefM
MSAPLRTSDMNGARIAHDALERCRWEVEVADTVEVRGLAPACLRLGDATRAARQIEYTIRYTSLMAKIVPAREFRARLSALLSDVADRRDHVLVTRNGKPAAALVPIDEYDALEETAEILSDSDSLAAIDAGLRELSRGEIVTLADLRAELDERRSRR